ncbi:hypothetical protein BGZ94_003138 [Podila epigama]|nr:hypothetical protein BGZ94_003138 [Podila epigama]
MLAVHQEQKRIQRRQAAPAKPLSLARRRLRELGPQPARHVQLSNSSSSGGGSDISIENQQTLTDDVSSSSSHNEINCDNTSDQPQALEAKAESELVQSAISSIPLAKVAPKDVTEISKDETKDSKDEKKDKKEEGDEPVSIQPLTLKSFLLDGLHLYISHLRHPSRIPGQDMISRVYAMGILPVLIVTLTIVQWIVGGIIILVNHTKLGSKLYQKFLEDHIDLLDDTDYVDPDSNDEALRQLTRLEVKEAPSFSYHIAQLLLIMSSMTYDRDEKLVAQASKILTNARDQKQRDEAARLLQESERAIDEKSKDLFGMRFMGISELKTLGGPFAGLFYNDEAIVLVFKGTSVLAFNEYLIDFMIQRIDASEYLYGEVHKGFYESLFPDPKPLTEFEKDTYDRTNPFHTIMESIFEIAQAAKSRTGKPVNLWFAGHSLGGALAAMTMARLQMPIHEQDPLMMPQYTCQQDGTDSLRAALSGLKGDDKNRKSAKSSSSSTLHTLATCSTASHQRTVWDEMLARFNSDQELVILRDAYSHASPKVGDSSFAATFGRNHAEFCRRSPYKPAYWRVVADKDIVPRMPPGCSVEPGNPIDHLMAPHLKCTICPPRGPRPVLRDSLSGFSGTTNHEDQPLQSKVTSLSASQSSSSQTLSNELNGLDDLKGVNEAKAMESLNGHQHLTPSPGPSKHLHSLLDYQHVGQLVKVFNASRIPVVKPSPFEADMSQGVLRTKQEMDEFLSELEQVSKTWAKHQEKLQSEKNEKAEGQVAHETIGPSTLQTDTKQEAQVPSAETAAAATTTTKNTELEHSDIEAARRQLEEDMKQARELYSDDELTLLREPSSMEQILLSFPGLLAHAPATYQRNLVRARFYFESFPGAGFEKRMDEKGWVQGDGVVKEKEDVVTLVEGVAGEGMDDEKKKDNGVQDEEEEEEEEEGVVLEEDEEELHFTLSVVNKPVNKQEDKQDA